MSRNDLYFVEFREQLFWSIKEMSVSAGPPNILLVDGNEQSRRTFSSFFEGRGWSYDIVPDRKLLAGALERGTYDIIIADVEMAGPETVKTLREIHEKRPSQAIIAVSPTASYEDALRLFRSGATDLLARPIDFSWLERVIQQVASSRQTDARAKASYRHVIREEMDLCFTSADLSDLDAVSLPLVSRLVDEGMLSQNDGLKLRLAVQEALLNGLEHGNLELDSQWKEEIAKDGADKFSSMRKARLADPEFANRRVTVKLSFSDFRLEVVVKDQGGGFLNGRGGPESDRIDPLSCSGRGLALMSSAVDEVRFTSNGSEVTMIKWLDASKNKEAYGS